MRPRRSQTAGPQQTGRGHVDVRVSPRRLARLAVALGAAVAANGVRPERAAAQWIQITQAAPASGSAGPNWAVVTVQFGGSYGTTQNCGASGCAYYPYDYTPSANSLRFTLNGVRQDHLLRVASTAESCTTNSDGTTSCTRTYTATNGKLTLPPNANTTIVAQAVGDGYRTSGNGTPAVTWTFFVNAADRAHPLVDLGAYEGSNRDVSRCAAACFDAVATISPPTYTSMDVARGVTLVYRSNRGRGALTLDVTDPSTTPPSQISLRLSTSSGQQVTFDNGATQLYFTRGQSQLRLAGTFGGYGLAYGAFPYEMTATVTGYWGDGDYRVVDVPVRVPVEGQWSSPYGAGWTVAGVRTIRGNADANRPTMTVLDGTGTVQVFDGSCAQLKPQCTFMPPPGVASWPIVPQQADAYGATYQQHLLPNGGTLIGYDARGNEVYAVDAVGGRTRYYWRDDARLDSIVDPAGQKTTFQWDGTGHLSGILDPMKRLTAVQVNGSGDLVSAGVYDASGNQALPPATYAYQNHLLTQYTQPGGGTWAYTYDAAGKLLTTTAPAVQTKDGTQQPVTRTQSSLGQRLAGTQSGQGSAATPLPGTTPIAVGDLVTDAGNNTVTYLLDRFGQPSYIRFPDGSVDNVTADANGYPTRSVAANGHDVRAFYNPDQSWLVDSTWDATTNRHVRYTYDPYQSLLGVLAVTGDVTPVTNTWTGSFLMKTQVGDSTGPRTKYYYNPSGRPGDPRPDSVVDQNGHKTAYVYASTGLQNTTSVTTPAGTMRYGYDGYGNVRTVTNPRGDTTHTDYDALDRVVATVDGLGHRTQQQYGTLYPSVTTDAKGATYQQTPNVLGAVQSATDPAGGTTAYSYYGSGALWQKTDRRGAIAQFGYDALGRVTWTYLSDVANPTTASPTFWYDPAGHLAVASNAETIDSVFYDNAGRVVDERHVFRPLLGTGHPAEINVPSAYDAQNRRTQVQLGWVNHGLQTLAQYSYNGLGQLATLTDPAGRGTTFTYNAEGALVKTTIPAIGVDTTPATTLHVDGGHRYLTNPAVNQLFGTQLLFDSLGGIRERLGITSNQGPGYQLDRAGRLAAVSQVSYSSSPQNCTPLYGGTRLAPTSPGEQPTGYSCTGGNVQRTETPLASFTYDAVGNPTYGGATYGSGTDSLANRLAVFNGQKSFYDAAGNRWMHTDADGSWRDRPAWNVLGQMKGIAVWTQQRLPAPRAADSVDFGYDAQGRRVRKTVLQGGQVLATTYYVWDGDQVAAELDGNGNVTAAYAYYPGTDRPHSARVHIFAGSRDSTYYYVQGDAPGNVLGLVDAAGNVAAQYQVDAWGQPTTVSEPKLPGDWEQPYLFAGRTYDRETGYYYNRARYYDPVARRLLSEDPAGLAGGINLYAYAGNDPVNYSDPFGLCPPQDKDFTTCTGFWTVAGAATGALLGGGVGLGGGPAAPATVTAGALEGATLGARAGIAIDGLVFASKQARAVGKAEGQVDHINTHLGRLENEPDSPAANGWRKEIRAGIETVGRQLKDMGTKTGAEWTKTIDEWTKRLNDLTPR